MKSRFTPNKAKQIELNTGNEQQSVVLSLNYKNFLACLPGFSNYFLYSGWVDKTLAVANSSRSILSISGIRLNDEFKCCKSPMATEANSWCATSPESILTGDRGCVKVTPAFVTLETPLNSFLKEKPSVLPDAYFVSWISLTCYSIDYASPQSLVKIVWSLGSS